MKFECVRCGNCCRQNGDLRLLPEDVKKILKHFDITFEEFCERYPVTSLNDWIYFIEIQGHCPFLNEDNSCEIQNDKPFFCENYIPFVDREGSLIYEVCQGLGHGKEWSQAEIDDRYNLMISKLVFRG